jgi:hypothetical protein
MRITALESGPDGMWLASARIDGTVRIGHTGEQSLRG